jgi:hypothetical protein
MLQIFHAGSSISGEMLQNSLTAMPFSFEVGRLVILWFLKNDIQAYLCKGSTELALKYNR